MINELVIDVNVFCHSYDPRQPAFEDYLAFLLNFKSSPVALCVDEGANFISESTNASPIIAEYREQISSASTAYGILAHLFANGRVKYVSKKVPYQTARKINQLVNDKTDRIFVRVAINTSDSRLVSHDTAAFPLKRRKLLLDDTGVSVHNAIEAAELL